MTTKTVTLAEILDAIEKNGLPQTRDGWFFKGYSPTFERVRGQNYMGDFEYITEACALGQAAINLGVSPIFTVDEAPVDIMNEIVEMNDHTLMTFPEIAAHFRNAYAAYLDAVYESQVVDYTGKIRVEV